MSAHTRYGIIRNKLLLSTCWTQFLSCGNLVILLTLSTLILSLTDLSTSLIFRPIVSSILPQMLKVRENSLLGFFIHSSEATAPGISKLRLRQCHMLHQIILSVISKTLLKAIRIHCTLHAWWWHGDPPQKLTAIFKLDSRIWIGLIISGFAVWKCLFCQFGSEFISIANSSSERMLKHLAFKTVEAFKVFVINPIAKWLTAEIFVENKGSDAFGRVPIFVDENIFKTVKWLRFTLRRNV